VGACCRYRAKESSSGLCYRSHLIKKALPFNFWLMGKSGAGKGLKPLVQEKAALFVSISPTFYRLTFNL
jgi:hypothetical protein